MTETSVTGKPGARWAFLGALDIGTDDDPYLDRLRIVQTPWFGIYLHHIHRPDRDPAPHDHPWAFASVVLTGAYTERVWPDKGTPSAWHLRQRPRGSLRWLGRRAAHIITDATGPLWTLVIVGPRRGEWGFWEDGQFVPWRQYMARHGGVR